MGLTVPRDILRLFAYFILVVTALQVGSTGWHQPRRKSTDISHDCIGQGLLVTVVAQLRNNGLQL